MILFRASNVWEPYDEGKLAVTARRRRPAPPSGVSVSAPAATARVLAFFAERRELIGKALRAYLTDRRAELGRVDALGAEACGRLEHFALSGKMVRGGLVCYAASLAAPPPPSAVDAAAAMELFQSGLLIHDDIMDRDARRRGGPSLHYQYAEMAARDGLRDTAHLGEALGICAADIAFFLAFDVLATLEADPSLKNRLVSLFARELSLVGAAQMMDMAAAARTPEQTTDDTLRLYLYKTGRYTFSLPLLAGSLLGGIEQSRAVELERAGELLGLLFQIKDDEIGLFGDERDTGKPVGGDIREGKKTIYHTVLARRATAEELHRIHPLWGSPELGEREIRFILDCMERRGVREEIAGLVDSLAARVREIAPEQRYPFLADLLAYSLERSS